MSNTVDVHRNGSIFTVFVNTATDKPYKLSPLGEPPEDGWPLTFNSLPDVQRAFGTDLNIIGEAVKESTAVVPEVTAYELLKYSPAEGNTQKIVSAFCNSGTATSGYTQTYPKQTSLNDLIEEKMQPFNDALAFLVIRFYRYKAEKNPTKKALLKEYCNGYARALKNIFPACDSHLEKILNSDTATVEEDSFIK